MSGINFDGPRRKLTTTVERASGRLYEPTILCYSSYNANWKKLEYVPISNSYIVSTKNEEPVTHATLELAVADWNEYDETEA